MREGWIDGFRLENSFEFIGAKYFTNETTYFLISPETGTSILLDAELFETLETQKPSEELQFKLTQRALATFEGSRDLVDDAGEGINPTFFVIDLTNACGLRCAYCFRHFDPNEETTISEKTLDDICDFIIAYCKKYNQKRISIQPWGGEPIFEFEKIKRIDDRMKAAGVRAVITTETSGVGVTEEIAKEAKERGLEFGVSIDGPKDLHDKQRLLADGRGSFDAMKIGRDRLREAGYGWRHGSITTVTTEGLGRAREIIDFFTGDFDLRQFKFNLTKQNPQMRRAGLELTVEQAQAFAAEMFDALVDACRRGAKVSEGNARVKIGNLLWRRRGHICLSRGCLGGRRLVGFDRRGGVCVCDMTEVEEAKFGSIYDGRDLVEMLNEAVKTHPYFQKRSDEKCERCAWRFFCRGGCPSAGFFRRGEFTSQIDEMECAYNEVIYPKIVELILNEPEIALKLAGPLADEEENDERETQK